MLMDRAEISRSPLKRNRRFSEMTISSKLTHSTVDEADSHDLRGRRKISFDHKELRSAPRREEITVLEAKCNFKLSTEVLSFEMEEQRNHQLKTINANPQLFAYYNCLKKLFMILYQASIPLRENRFHLNEEILNTNNLQILAVLFDQDSPEKNFSYFRSLETFADNMSYLSNSSSEFEGRMELVAIKSCLHNQKRPRIENAFLNTKIEAYWKKIEERFSHLDVYSYIEDQFEKAEEKLCFIEIQEFVKSKLSTQAFGQLLRRNCQLQEIDHDMNFSFKFQFFMTQELCFHTLTQLFKDEAAQETGICEIM